MRDYLEHRVVSRRAKLLALLLLWSSIIASALLATQIIAVRVLLITIASGVTIYLLSLPSTRDDRPLRNDGDPARRNEPAADSA